MRGSHDGAAEVPDRVAAPADGATGAARSITPTSAATAHRGTDRARIDGCAGRREPEPGVVIRR
jgi:hypothetical protein